MINRISILIIMLLLVSCDDSTKKNYKLIERILKNPDQLESIYNDTSITSNLFRDHIKNLKEIDSWQDKLKRDNFHIKEYFSDGYSISQDEILPQATPIPGKGAIFHYMVHDITIISKKDNSKYIHFTFNDENNNKDWRLEYISIASEFH